MKYLALVVFALCISNVQAQDCVVSSAHGSDKVHALGAAKILHFKGVKPKIKFVANAAVTVPSVKLTGASVKIDLGPQSGKFQFLNNKCVPAPPSPATTPAPAPAPAPPPVASSATRNSRFSLMTSFSIALAAHQVVTTGERRSFVGRGALLSVLLLATLMNTPGAAAQTCTDAAAVEVHMDTAAADAITADAWKSVHNCPPESFWWKHHKDVHGGYEGCVSEIGLIPCGTNGFSGMAQSYNSGSNGLGVVDAKLPVKWDGKTCVKSAYTIQDEFLYIRGGLPHDGPELKKRTGINPVVTFPLLRSPYPRMLNSEDHTDDDEDMKATLKEFMLYQKAFTKAQLDEFEVMGNEGAEQGMVTIWAAKVLEIASTTCNRNIYALVEAPSYGYSLSRIAELVNSYSSDFLKTHLNWYNASSSTTVNVTCPTTPVTVNYAGWMPGTAYPERMSDGYHVNYVATSTDPTSPFFESMVFPENPSGKVKTANIPASANRLVCDGCYLYPTYFGPGQTKGKATGAPDSYYANMKDKEGYYIPTVPNCDSWAFSITKMYSAAVRAGTVMYKKTNPYYLKIGRRWTPLSEGSYSEWSWWGQIQIWQMLMSKPLYDPTSWMGAYAKLQDEKSEALYDGFKDCPVIEYLNPKTTAYSWYRYTQSYNGRTASTPDFFKHCLNIYAFDYYWGFRGADPSGFYGTNYTVRDFHRLHLYRDLSVYKEVGRRAKIVCGGGKLPGMLSIAEWKALAGHTVYTNGTMGTSGRKLLADIKPDVFTDHSIDASHVDHADPSTVHLKHQSEAERKYHNKLHAEHLNYDKVTRDCMEKENTVSTDCLFAGLGELKHKEKEHSPVSSSGMIPQPIVGALEEPDAP